MVATLVLFLLLAAARPQESIEVWLCPVHRDVQSTTEGSCSVCQRSLEKREIVPVWSCPMHGQIEEAEEGSCPICSMRLTPTTRELQWVCPRHPDVVEHSPGSCPRGGLALESQAVPMAHGDHNPRHGGILFMAPNGFNHLEGTLSDVGVFRFYLYDDFTRPLHAEHAKARIGDRWLEAAPDGTYREVQLEDPEFPAETLVFVQFEGGENEERFDFIFPGSIAPTQPVAGPLVIPSSAEQIIEEIFRRNEWLERLVHEGGWTELYIPALEAKELALALSASEGETVALPVKKIVRAAWLLDMYGDVGNRPKVESAYRLFETGVRELEEMHAR